MGRRGRLHDEDAARRLSAAVDRTLAALADPVRRRAVELLGKLHVSDLCETPEIAGPGFINLRLSHNRSKIFHQTVSIIIQQC